MELGETFGEITPDGLLVTHDMTQEELAQLVGASRETVNKALADFAQRGWIRLESRQVLILDVERLGKVEFCTDVYNYNTHSDDNPRNALLLCTAQGTSFQQDGAGTKKMFIHEVDPEGTIHRYWLEAERSKHKVGGAQIETKEEAEAAAARGKAVATFIGTRAMGTRMNVQLLIQVPLKLAPRQILRSYSSGCRGGGGGGLGGIGRGGKGGGGRGRGFGSGIMLSKCKKACKPKSTTMPSDVEEEGASSDDENDDDGGNRRRRTAPKESFAVEGVDVDDAWAASSPSIVICIVGVFGITWNVLIPT
jgi:hypothetical protein